MPLITRCLLTLVLLALLNGCYYTQLVTGQMHVLQAREPVAKVVATLSAIPFCASIWPSPRQPEPSPANT